MRAPLAICLAMLFVAGAVRTAHGKACADRPCCKPRPVSRPTLAPARPACCQVVPGHVAAAAPQIVERTHEVAVPAGASEVAIVAVAQRRAAPPTPARAPPPRLFAHHMSRLL